MSAHPDSWEHREPTEADYAAWYAANPDWPGYPTPDSAARRWDEHEGHRGDE